MDLSPRFLELQWSFDFLNDGKINKEQSRVIAKTSPAQHGQTGVG